ncbi:unnamed protein product [Arctia plantaginis]|uniref:Uncharacterized protein n=1 Tax=Arctia plantaginis TaxID=874455 RepID=A0A8S0Z7H3_ARCPL|nr:unnamed protein product [Arctia plantaginis]
MNFVEVMCLLLHVIRPPHFARRLCTSSIEAAERERAKDPSLVWEVIQKAIAEILVMKEQHLVAAGEHYPSQNNFFEMMRFEFILDEFLKVYLLKVKRTPEFDSAKSAEELLLYEQLLYNLFSLTGVLRKLVVTDNSRDNTDERDMITSHKHISVFAKVCRSSSCKENCHTKEVCEPCKFCPSKTIKEHLLRAHTEFLYRGDFKRLFPPPMFKIEVRSIV